MRGEPEHFLYSKLMCWLALDRAVALADLLHAGDRADGWAAEADRIRAAREVLDRAAGYVNDVGLLAEEIHPDTGEQLGNFPQAFSHIGLIKAAWSVSQAESGPS